MDSLVINKQQLDLLAAQLPELRFDVAVDSVFARTELAQAYLDFYAINFARELEGVVHGFGCVDDGEFKLAVHYWLYSADIESRGTLFLVHGYFDHSGLYGPLIHEALERGFAVVIFDLPGHGLSSGAPAEIDSFEQYAVALEAVLNKAGDLLPQPWFIAGQSTGGAVVVDHLWRSLKSKRKYPFIKTVVLAPLVRPRGWKELGWSLPLLKVVTSALKRSFAPSSHDEVFHNFISTQDPLQAQTLPLVWMSAMKQWGARVKAQTICDSNFLLIQGDADQTVDWKFNIELLKEKFPTMTQVVIAGARHHLVREAEPWKSLVCEQVFGYLGMGNQK